MMSISGGRGLSAVNSKAVLGSGWFKISLKFSTHFLFCSSSVSRIFPISSLIIGTEEFDGAYHFVYRP